MGQWWWWSTDFLHQLVAYTYAHTWAQMSCVFNVCLYVHMYHMKKNRFCVLYVSVSGKFVGTFLFYQQIFVGGHAACALDPFILHIFTLVDLCMCCMRYVCMYVYVPHNWPYDIKEHFLKTPKPSKVTNVKLRLLLGCCMYSYVCTIKSITHCVSGCSIVDITNCGCWTI